MKLLSSILLLLALVLTAAAGDVTGKWSGTFAAIGPDGSAGGSNPAFLILKQTGDTLTGTAGSDEGQQWPIENVKITGNKITGAVNPSDGATYTLSLTVDGDRMTGEIIVDAGGQTQKCKIELKRVQ